MKRGITDDRETCFEKEGIKRWIHGVSREQDMPIDVQRSAAKINDLVNISVA